MGGEWVLRRDDDGHWYMLPRHLRHEFDELLAKGQEEDDYLDFEIAFGHMRTDGPESFVFLEYRNA